jgi:hypothetical protein
MKRFSLVLISILALASCGYDGKYRYACQDPENWGKTECEPPACKVDGACTETLLGWDPSEVTETTIGEVVAP